MNQLNPNYEKDDKIIAELKKVILDTYPIIDDRLDILLSNQCPTMNINFNFNDVEKNITDIDFLIGNRNFKFSSPQRIRIDGTISLNVLNNIIEFILSDHDHISSILKYNDTITLKFAVNLKDENMRGISCGDIELELNFRFHSNKKELSDYYLKGIINGFYDKLKNTETFKNEYKRYISLIKEKFINSLTQEELQLFLSQLSTEDICSMLLNIPDERFCELYGDFNQAKEEKILIKQKEETNK